jgi:xanthine dehydrogenase molybdopterin-binding subunit B
MKVLRNHVLGAVDTGRKQGTMSQAEKCKKHQTENIKYYCCNHDLVGCGDCIVSYHQKCETKFIRNLAKNIEESSDFKNILKGVNNL